MTKLIADEALREAADKIIVSMIRTYSPEDSLIPLAEGEVYTAYDRLSARIAILDLIAAAQQQLLAELLEQKQLVKHMDFQEEAVPVSIINNYLTKTEPEQGEKG